MLEERVTLAVNDPPDYYDTMVTNSNSQIDWFNNRAAYGKGLIAIQKRLDKQGTDAEAAKAKAIADAAAATTNAAGNAGFDKSDKSLLVPLPGAHAAGA